MLVLGGVSGQGLSLSKQTELGGVTEMRVKANKRRNQAGNKRQIFDSFETAGPRH